MPVACAPAAINVELPLTELHGVGSCCQFFEDFPDELRCALRSVSAELVPRARDLLPLALEMFSRGELQNPRDVQPVYVRDEINWKKIPQQGKQQSKQP